MASFATLAVFMVYGAAAYTVTECTVTGDVFIGSESDVTDLVARVDAECASNSAWTISGVLSVRNSATLSEVDALARLARISGQHSTGISLEVRNNAALTSLSGLGGLAGTLPGALNVNGNPQLANLDGLDGLTGITGQSGDGTSLAIVNNAALASVVGLRGLSGNIPGILQVEQNPQLASLEGLHGLTGISGRHSTGISLYIFNNAALTTLTGLRGLGGDLAGALVVQSNAALTSLDGLQGISRITIRSSDGNSLIINNNAALMSITGLRGLSGVLTGSIWIEDCPELTSIAGLEGITGTGTDTDGDSWFVTNVPKLCMSADDRNQISSGVTLSGGGNVVLPASQSPSGSSCATCPALAACGTGNGVVGHCFSKGEGVACRTNSPTASPSSSPTQVPTTASPTIVAWGTDCANPIHPRCVSLGLEPGTSACCPTLHDTFSDCCDNTQQPTTKVKEWSSWVPIATITVYMSISLIIGIHVCVYSKTIKFKRGKGELGMLSIFFGDKKHDASWLAKVATVVMLVLECIEVVVIMYTHYAELYAADCDGKVVIWAVITVQAVDIFIIWITMVSTSAKQQRLLVMMNLFTNLFEVVVVSSLFFNCGSHRDGAVAIVTFAAFTISEMVPIVEMVPRESEEELENTYQATSDPEEIEASSTSEETTTTAEQTSEGVLRWCRCLLQQKNPAKKVVVAPDAESERQVATPTSPTNIRVRRKSAQCVICLDARPSHVFSPCGHLVACEECSSSCGPGQKVEQCPMCRKKIGLVIKVWGVPRSPPPPSRKKKKEVLLARALVSSANKNQIAAAATEES